MASIDIVPVVDRRGVRLVVAVCTLVTLTCVAQAAGPATAQRTFASPDEAAAALVDAVKRDDVAALRAIFGPDSDKLLTSGDEVEDAAVRKRVADAVAQAMRVEPDGDARAELIVGTDEWPFPVPMVKTGATWRFDTAAGEDEIVNRRIGRNELRAIATCRAFVEAQREYAAADRDGKGAGAFAAKFVSTAGKRDGLYWPVAEGESPSPLGPLAAAAAHEGYKRKGDAPVPFHGYYFRVLTAQGAHAPGGAKNYVRDGRLTGGFAFVAYPASYGVSGVMTFVVNQQGIVFQKNLGPQTSTLAAKATRYDPDRSWEPVTD